MRCVSAEYINQSCNHLIPGSVPDLPILDESKLPSTEATSSDAYQLLSACVLVLDVNAFASVIHVKLSQLVAKKIPGLRTSRPRLLAIKLAILFLSPQFLSSQSMHTLKFDKMCPQNMRWQQLYLRCFVPVTLTVWLLTLSNGFVLQSIHLFTHTRGCHRT